MMRRWQTGDFVLRAAMAAVLLGAACAGAAAPQQQASTIYIDNVHVVPMTTSGVLRDHAVLVEDGVITALGPADAVAMPAGALRIDGRGGYLMPGLIDMHAHHEYGNAALPGYLAHGVTTIFNLNGSAGTLALRDSLRAGALRGPNLFTAGPSLSGVPPRNPTFIALGHPDSARQEVRRQKAAGYDALKPYTFLTADVYAAIADEARAVGIPMLGHVPQSVGAFATIAAGQQNIAHMEELIRTGQETPADLQALAAALKEAGSTVTANLFAYAEYLRLIPDLGSAIAHDEARYASAANLSEKLPSNSRARRDNPDAFAQMLRTRLAIFRQATRMFVDSGVPVFVGTDTDIFGFAGHSAHEELRELIAAGLTQAEALAAATRLPGAFLHESGMSERTLGVIADGAQADMVLLRANPLETVPERTSIDGVMVRGRWHTAASLQAQRDSIADANEVAHAAIRAFDEHVLRDPVRAVATLRASTGQSGDPVVAESVLRRYARQLTDNPAGARAVSELAVELYPHSSSALFELARSLSALREHAAARGALERALAIDPHDAELQQRLAEVVAAARE